MAEIIHRINTNYMNGFHLAMISLLRQIEGEEVARRYAERLGIDYDKEFGGDKVEKR